ncbi:MAG: aldo/keto reductase [Dehalococcoidales bacterium]|nr:aldo/keto reductase [Dehalococcoidales bacterium]
MLGFGAMRLPVIGQDQANIDEMQAIEMIRYAADQGVNYIDSGYMYHMGKSEVVVGKALKGSYREMMKIATKLPARMVEKPEDFDRIFEEQLKRLDGGMIDFYLLHGLDRAGWEKVRDMGVLRWAEKKIAEGVIGHLGFSFHDSFEVFKEIVDAYDNWVLAQVLYNYMDEKEQAGRRGVEYAAAKGLAVVVMEPLRGGRLSKNPPPAPVAEVMAKARRKFTPVEWAFHWVWSQPEVTVALSGMSTMAQVVENVRIASSSRPGLLTEEDLKVIDEVRKAYRSLSPIPCSQCRYCQPCPNNVEIPRVFQLYNDAVMYDDMKTGQFMYNGPFGIPQDRRADRCTGCGECLTKCPQKIDIPAWLKKAHDALYLENPPMPPMPPPSRKDTQPG